MNEIAYSEIAKDAMIDLWQLYILMDEEQLSNPKVIGLFSSLAATLTLFKEKYNQEEEV